MGTSEISGTSIDEGAVLLKILNNHVLFKEEEEDLKNQILIYYNNAILNKYIVYIKERYVSWVGCIKSIRLMSNAQGTGKTGIVVEIFDPVLERKGEVVFNTYCCTVFDSKEEAILYYQLNKTSDTEKYSSYLWKSYKHPIGNEPSIFISSIEVVYNILNEKFLYFSDISGNYRAIDLKYDKK